MISLSEAGSIAAKEASGAAAPASQTSEESLNSTPTSEQEAELREAVAAADTETAQAIAGGPDIYGQVHPVETPELISRGLSDLEGEIGKLPPGEKGDLMRATERCPDLVNEKERLKFLRCEVFNADLAAHRLARYWKRRVLIFGDEKAFIPLTLSEALKDDDIGLQMGFVRIIPNVKDPSGRALILGDPSRLVNPHSNRTTIQRAVWYALHAALEEESVQQKGVVMIFFPHNAKMSQFDRKLMKMNVESLKGCLPVRLSGVHICHPPKFFAVVFPLLKLLMGERLRKRIRVHSGSEKKVTKHLANFGLTKNKLPSELGGDIVLDQSGWLMERKDSGL